MHYARVEIHIGVQLALHEVVVFQRDLFQRHRKFEQGVILKAEGVQNFTAGLLHQFGARVVVLVNAVAKSHQLDAGCLVLDLVDELADLADTTHFLDVLEHVQTSLIGTAVRRAPKTGHARRDSRERIGARAPTQAHRGRGGVLFVVRMQDKDAVERALDHRVHHVFFTRGREHHMHEVAGVTEIVLRVHVGLTGAVLVRHGHQCRHLRDQADRRNFAVLGIVDVGAVMVESRQRAHQAGHDGHRMGIAPEAAQKKLHLLVHHRMVGDDFGEFGFGGNVGQVAVQEQVAGFEKIAVGRDLLDRVTAV